jgi:hypothetical protein
MTVTCGPSAAIITTSCDVTGLPDFVATYKVTVVAVNATGSSVAGVTSATTLEATVVAGPHAVSVHGHAVAGKTVTLTISGSGFYGAPRITGHARTVARVTMDTGKLLTVRVSVAAGSPNGTFTFTIRLANGKTCTVSYVQG